MNILISVACFAFAVATVFIVAVICAFLGLADDSLCAVLIIVLFWKVYKLEFAGK